MLTTLLYENLAVGKRIVESELVGGNDLKVMLKRIEAALAQDYVRFYHRRQMDMDEDPLHSV